MCQSVSFGKARVTWYLVREEGGMAHGGFRAVMNTVPNDFLHNFRTNIMEDGDVEELESMIKHRNADEL